MISPCPLCNGTSSIYYHFKKQIFHRCGNCSGIFIDKTLLPGKKSESARYKEHNNNVEDEGYQKFVSPIASAILRNFSSYDSGLDFGAGSGPVITKILTDNGFNIKLYDPFFYNDKSLLDKQYDYIACCEVIEHFHNPKREFTLLKKLLKTNGKLYCMTHLYNESIDFHNWEYKRDITHVFFYHEKTIKYIKGKYGFSNVIIDGRLITFSN